MVVCHPTQGPADGRRERQQVGVIETNALCLWEGGDSPETERGAQEGKVSW
jgi:hypothetical protein